jgi:hypothetical protein
LVHKTKTIPATITASPPSPIHMRRIVTPPPDAGRF